MTTLTSAQQSFVDGLKLQNIDHRALQIVVAAMHVRNANAHGSFTSVSEAGSVLCEVVDKVAG